MSALAPVRPQHVPFVPLACSAAIAFVRRELATYMSYRAKLALGLVSLLFSLVMFSFVGKVVAAAVFLVMVSVVGLLAGRLLFRVEINHLLGGAVWLGLTGVVMLLLMMLVHIEHRIVGSSRMQSATCATPHCFFRVVLADGVVIGFASHQRAVDEHALGVRLGLLIACRILELR